MKQKLTSLGLFIFLLLAFSCSSNSKETPEAVVKKWCDLNAKVRQAESGSEAKEKAKEARKKYEDEIEKMEAKYGKEFADKVSEGTKACDQ